MTWLWIIAMPIIIGLFGAAFFLGAAAVLKKLKIDPTAMPWPIILVAGFLLIAYDATILLERILSN